MLHWHDTISASRGRMGGRVLFCWLIINVLIVLKQFPPNQILTIQEIYPLVGLESFAPESRSNWWGYAVGLGVARRSFDRPMWEPVVGMENPHCDTDGLQVTLTGPKESHHHHGTHTDHLQRPSRCWSLAFHQKRRLFYVLRYLRIVINGEINFSTFFS